MRALIHVQNEKTFILVDKLDAAYLDENTREIIIESKVATFVAKVPKEHMAAVSARFRTALSCGALDLASLQKNKIVFEVSWKAPYGQYDGVRNMVFSTQGIEVGE